jgi:hypothetical protein|nr:MAG TPA: hypothetical protein [Caudoviricetes sp.]
MPDNREIRLLDFIDNIENEERNKKAESDFKNSDTYKLRMIDKSRDEAKKEYLTKVLSDTYRDAIPLNDEYKVAYKDDIDKCFRDFLNERCPQGVEYYIKEAIKKNSGFAKKVLEAVNHLVDEKYNKLSLKLEEVTDEDLVFNNDKDEQKKVNVVGRELNTDEVASIVKDNVKQTAVSEIQRAKEEKEKLQAVEDELANDVKMNTPQKVEEAMRLKGLGQGYYKPSLFNGIMISNMNKIQAKMESGDNCEYSTYDALKDYPMTLNESATPQELAFIESVKEYTGYALVKALKLESFDMYKIDNLAQSYAQRKY